MLRFKVPDDDNQTGVEKYGVNNYEGTKSLKVKAPVRPTQMGPRALPPALPCALVPAPDPEAEAAELM